MSVIERREQTMKRIPVLLIAFAVLMAMTASAVAAPPPGKGKPDKPGDAPIEVTIDKAAESTWWLHEAGDVIIYDVVITNSTGEPIDATVGGDVTFSAPAPTALDPGTTLLKAAYTVDDGDMAAVSITNTVTVEYGTETASATYTQEIDPYPPCDFVDPDDDGLWTRTWSQMGDVYAICIWKPPIDGHWTITVTPDFTKRKNFSVTLRDGVPGNWCRVPEGAPDGEYYSTGILGAFDVPSGGINARWKPGDDPVVLNVYLPPGDVPGEDQGVCLHGGAGGETIGVGNPESYYLVAPGTVTAEIRTFTP
jgi:hypothetical protein